MSARVTMSFAVLIVKLLLVFTTRSRSTTFLCFTPAFFTIITAKSVEGSHTTTAAAATTTTTAAAAASATTSRLLLSSLCPDCTIYTNSDIAGTNTAGSHKVTSVEACAALCYSTSHCSAASWNGPQSAYHDNNCNLHCSGSLSKDAGETAIIVRKATSDGDSGPAGDTTGIANLCPRPPAPPPPSPPQAPSCIGAPDDWSAACKARDLLVVPHGGGDAAVSLHPEVGNGYLATVVQFPIAAKVFVAGVFSGCSQKHCRVNPSHRAALPAPLPVSMGGGGLHLPTAAALDIRGAAYMRRFARVGSDARAQAQMRFYAHRLRRNLLVLELSAFSPTQNNIRLALHGAAGAPNPNDDNMVWSPVQTRNVTVETSVATYPDPKKNHYNSRQHTVRVWQGTTREAEADTTPLHTGVHKGTVEVAIVLPYQTDTVTVQNASTITLLAAFASSIETKDPLQTALTSWTSGMAEATQQKRGGDGWESWGAGEQRGGAKGGRERGLGLRGGRADLVADNINRARTVVAAKDASLVNAIANTTANTTEINSFDTRTTTTSSSPPLFSTLLSPPLYQSHYAAWSALWASGIEIEGRDDAAATINSSLYYLLSSLRQDRVNSLSPGGLASQGYNGHTFWDCETWMYPSLLMLHPQLAQSLLAYRLARAPEARLKAASYNKGYRGTMFPWESGASGIEVCPSSASTGLYEQHITGDVSLAARQYWHATRNVTWLRQAFEDLIKGPADFWVSRVRWDSRGSNSSATATAIATATATTTTATTSSSGSTKNGTVAHIDGVICPDEYHMGNDSAYTNAVARISLDFAAQAAQILNATVDPAWHRTSASLHTPEDVERDITLEYDGYSGAKIKQADVVLLGFPLGVNMTRARRASDLAYYAARTDPGGPAMTWGMHALGYLELDNATAAASNFNRSFANAQQPFLVWTETPHGGTTNFLTGIGGFLQTVLFGLPGMRLGEQGLALRPRLIEGARSLVVRGLHYMGSILRLEYNASSMAIESAPVASAVDLVVSVFKGGGQQRQQIQLQPGHRISGLKVDDPVLIHTQGIASLEEN